MKMNLTTAALSFLLLTTSAHATPMLSYRCEHQSSQNAVQFPLKSYFYVVYDTPAVFNKYKILNFQKEKLHSVLEYANGETRELSFNETDKLMVVTDWQKFRKNFNLFSNELKQTLSVVDKEQELGQFLNIDFLSKTNDPEIYHSMLLTPRSKDSQAVRFQYVRPETEIEKKTLLPGDKIDYKIANKSILFNERSGMLLQVEVKVNTAFLRYVFVCRSWSADKIPLNYSTQGLNQVRGELAQFNLLEDDLAHAKGQFSSAVYDLMFRSLAQFFKSDSINEQSLIDNKVKIIHALVKSKVLLPYVRDLNDKKLNVQSEVKKQLFIFSQHHLPSEYSTLKTETLAKIYREMFEVMVSYSELSKKGYN